MSVAFQGVFSRGLPRLAATVCIGWVLACGGASAQPISFMGDRDLAPYEFLVNGVPRGANIDMVHAIGEVLGRKVDVQLLDWKEAQQRVLDGSADALSGVTPSAEREQIYDFTQTTLPVRFALFVRADERRRHAAQPMPVLARSLRIGVTKAGYPRLFFESRYPDAKLVFVDNQLDGTRRLASGDIDAFAAPLWSQEFLLSELGIERVVALPPFSEEALVMAVRKGNVALRAELDRALATLKANGELDRITERWSSTRVRLVSERVIWALISAAAAATTAFALLGWGLGRSRRQRRELERVAEQRRVVEQELRTTQAALRAADTRKDAFIAVLGHELRNPLAPISNAAYILGVRSNDTQEGRWALDVIRRQVTLMGRLIDDLLDVARITSGKLTLQRQPVRLDDVIGDALEGSRAALEAAGHHFEVVRPDGEVWIDADRDRMAQLVSNLLNNAAKYTPRGGHVTLVAAVEGDDLRISVRDDGIGIEPSQLSRLFEMFYQGERTHERTGGLGVGLWLTQQLVELHGGTIEAESDGLQQGSRFTVHLPRLRVAAPEGAAAPSQGVPLARPAGLRAFVADDNVDNTEAVARLLATLGCTVEMAFDGEEALRKLGQFQADIALIDIAMPGRDGLEVCRGLRRQAWGRKTYVVAMTGWGSAADREASLGAGFDEHWVKPIAPESVARIVERCAENRSAGDPA